MYDNKKFLQNLRRNNIVINTRKSFKLRQILLAVQAGAAKSSEAIDNYAKDGVREV